MAAGVIGGGIAGGILGVKGVKAYMRFVDKVGEMIGLNNGMLPGMAMKSVAAQRSKAVGKVVSKKGHSGISKMFRPSYDRSGLTYGAAAGVGAGLGMGLAGEGPRGRMAREGQIEGIDPSRGGGISPDLQFSTQGLTLGIHSKRKRRVI